MDKNDAAKYLATLLKRYRQRQEISQETFAEQMGISRDTLAKWEIGMAFPLRKYWSKIANALDISVAELFPGTYDGDLPAVMAHYSALPDEDREDIDNLIQSKYERHQRRQTTHGKKAE